MNNQQMEEFFKEFERKLPKEELITTRSLIKAGISISSSGLSLMRLKGKGPDFVVISPGHVRYIRSSVLKWCKKNWFQSAKEKSEKSVGDTATDKIVENLIDKKDNCNFRFEICVNSEAAKWMENIDKHMKNPGSSRGKNGVLIRGMLHFIRWLNVDLTKCKTEEDIAKTLISAV